MLFSEECVRMSIGNDEECSFILKNFSCKFDCRMETISLFNEQVNFLFLGVYKHPSL